MRFGGHKRTLIVETEDTVIGLLEAAIVYVHLI